jgi:CRP/FNR family transcriptional regulator
MGSYVTDRTLFAQGETSEYSYAIREGCVRLVRLQDTGHRQVLGFFGAGSFLGFSLASLCTTSAEAVTAVRACRFTRDELTTLLSSRPDFARHLLRMALLHVDAAQAQVGIMSRKSALGKFGAFLLNHGRQNPCNEDPRLVDLPMRREDIADYLGIATETVSRCINELASKNIVALESVHRLRICDKPALEACAESE